MPRTIDDAAAEAVRQIWPPHVVRTLRTARLALTEDGRARADRLHGTLPDDAFPALDPTTVAAPDGSGYDTIADQLNAHSAGLAPIASPTFTGTVTAPTIVATTGMTTVDLTSTGNAALGNADADVVTVWGHDRHKGAAPSIAVGVALGTGGSVSATIAGTDQVGDITLVAGASGTTTGTACTVTFAAARPDTNYGVQISPENANAGVNGVLVRAPTGTTTTWTLAFNVAPIAGNTQRYHYQLREWTH